MTGAAKNTVTRLLVDLGRACGQFQSRELRDLPCKRVQCDEIWAFCYAKEKNLPKEKQGRFGYGDVWTWVALDADTKLVISWTVGGRGTEWARDFMADVAQRISSRVQLTTDGYRGYLGAVEDAFGGEVDYAQLVKLYGTDTESDRRYSPAECQGTRKMDVSGRPDPDHISTSYVERQNLTMRMGMRRFTRLTNAFSRKLENLEAAVALHFMHYNYCRIHQTLRVTPAMAVGVTNRLWDLEDVIGLLEQSENLN